MRGKLSCRLFACLVLSCLGALNNGCPPVYAQSDLPVIYGQRSGRGKNSLNGTSVFAELLRDYIVDVKSATRLSPRIDHYDILFWFPDSYSTVTEEERIRLEQWLSEGWDRTLVIVGRDYDAAQDYLNDVVDQVDSESALEYRRRLANEAITAQLQRVEQSESVTDGWVIWESGARRPVQRISGPWAADLQTARLTQGRYPRAPVTGDNGISSTLVHEVKLTADDKPFIIEVTDGRWSEGRVIVISNGSFLLNYGLTDPNNRQLAEQLISELELDTYYDSALFLESDDYGLPVVDREKSSQSTLWDWIREWPFSFFLPHFLVVGIFVYFVYFPIFGRPKRLRGPSSTDFGQHVEALGELMEKTRDRDYAVRHLRYYNEHVRRDSTGLGMVHKRSAQSNSRNPGNNENQHHEST